MRVLVAARLSQLSDGQTGLDTQDQQSAAWAAANGHVIVDIAADRKSGTSQPWDRPKLRPWVTDPARMAQYDAVLAYRLDRLSRGDNQSTNAIEAWAHQHGKKLLTVDGLAYPCEGADGIRWDVTKRIAHDEWLKTSERYRRMQGYLRTATRPDGETGFLVGRPPFGYDAAPVDGSDHMTLVPNDLGRRYVAGTDDEPGIFARVIRGDSLAAIARWLDGEGVRPVCKRPACAEHGCTHRWWARSIGTLVRSTTYAGRRPSGGTILRVEPLVDAAVFRRAGEALDGRPKRGATVEETRATLSGILTCPRCGDSPMYRITAGSGNQRRTVWYRCTGRGSQRKGCGNMVPVAAADDLVDAIMAAMDAPVMTSRVIPGSDHAAEIDGVKMDLRSLDPDAADYDERHAELRAELARLKTLPAVPDRVEWASTGQTYGQEWARLDAGERGAWLRSKGIRVHAAKTAGGAAESAFPALRLAAMGAATIADDGAHSVIVTWLGAGLDAAA